MPSKAYSLWPIAFALVMFFGGLTMCRERAAKSIADPSEWTNIHGDPLDAADDETICPDCGGWLLRHGGYDYRCRQCGAEMQIKRDAETGKYIWHR